MDFQSADFLNNLPAHVGVIMDGNGRWATQRSLPRSKGHRAGMDKAKEIVAAASDTGIKWITLYIFSTENWKRTEEEVGYLMTLITGHLKQEFEFYKAHGIRIKHVGDISRLPKDVQTAIADIIEETKDFTGTTLVLAINYGGKDEIVRGINKLLAEKKQAVTQEEFDHCLDVADLPPVDLLIRTGGEKRLSNFLLWQTAYAELLFTDTLWPDYNKEEFLSDLAEYEKRNRRFGAVSK